MTAARMWTLQELADHSRESISRFRDERLAEPIEQYLVLFDKYRTAVETIIEDSVDLSLFRANALTYLTDPDMLYAVRYLAGPPISSDDLKVLAADPATTADASLAPGPLRTDPAMVDRLVDVIFAALDRTRFPWVSEDREPSDAERQTAIISTTALIATQVLQTSRRSQAKNDQEDLVAQALLDANFTQVPTRAISNHTQFPRPGEFCRESQFGTRKADLVVGLWDGRQMPIECKVSNSSTNSVKRLNNDAAVKAKLWLAEFGSQIAVPAAVLSGVFKVHNLDTAQRDGLSIFWGHRLDDLVSFIETTETP